MPCMTQSGQTSHDVLAVRRFGTTKKALAFSPPKWAFSAVLVVEGRSNAWHISDRPLRPRGRRRDTLLRSIAGGGRGARREARRLARKARRLARRDTDA